MIKAAPKAIRPAFLPLFLFSRTADTSDNVIMDRANARKVNLCDCIHLLTAKLPKPKLARTRDTFQQKANIVADTIAPTLFRALNIFSSFLHFTTDWRRGPSSAPVLANCPDFH